MYVLHIVGKVGEKHLVDIKHQGIVGDALPSAFKTKSSVPCKSLGERAVWGWEAEQGVGSRSWRGRSLMVREAPALGLQSGEGSEHRHRE
jgi:hypothetical protein